MSYVLEMLSHPIKPRALLALQETHISVVKELKHILPKRYTIMTTFDNHIAHGDIFIYDNERFTKVAYKGDYFKGSRNTWMALTLNDNSTGEQILVVQSHVPGGQVCERYLDELAQVVIQEQNLSHITVVMGDQNRPPNCFKSSMLAAILEHGYDTKHQVIDLSIPYPTHVNTHREASWIDNIFVNAPSGYWDNIFASSKGEDFFKDLIPMIDLLQKKHSAHGNRL